jgi:branched-chain amino acid transport system ATP-binding protein
LANPLLEVKDLGVSYGDVHALWDVSLTVEEGTIVALVGINGAGKSTLLKAISGLLHPNHGEIIFEGKSLGRMSTKARVDLGIVQVPEGRRLFQQLTIYDNLRLGAYLPRPGPTLRTLWSGCTACFLCSRKEQTAKPAC